MVAINRLNQVDKLVDEDIIPIWDVSSGRTRAVLASTFKEYIGDVTAGTHVSSGQYSAGTLTLKLTDNTEVSISGWTDLTGIDFRDDDAEVGKFTSVNFKGDGVQVSHSNGELQVEIERSAVAPTLALHFAGIYDSLQDLQDAITSPSSNMQAIVIQPSEKYYHGVGGSWVELAPVGAFHPTYLGTYDTVGNLQSAYPSPSKESLAIVGTTSKAFYIYDGSKWDGLTHTDLPALDARVTDAEGKILTLQNKDTQHDQQLSAVGADISQLQGQVYTGNDIQDDQGNSLADITGIKFVGAEVSDDDGDKTATVTVKPKITVANGQQPGSTSATGNALIFEGATIIADPSDPNVLRITTKDDSAKGLNVGDGATASRDVQTLIFPGHQAYGSGTDAYVHIEFKHFKTIAERDAWSTKFKAQLSFDVIASVDADSNGFTQLYRFDAATKSWKDYDAQGVIMSDSNGAIPKNIKTVVFGPGFSIQQAGDQEDAALVTYTEPGAGTGGSPLTVEQSWGSYEQVTNVNTISTRFPLEVAMSRQNPDDANSGIATLTIKPGTFQPMLAPSYLAYLKEDVEIVGKIEQGKELDAGAHHKGALWFSDVIVPAGVYIEERPADKSWGIQEADDLDPNVTGGTNYLLAARIHMKDKAPSDGMVRLYIYNKSVDPFEPTGYLDDIDKNPLVVERHYKIGEELGVLDVMGIVTAKGIQEFSINVVDTFTDDIIMLTDRTEGASGLLIQALTSTMKTGLGLLQFESDTSQNIEFSSHYLGESRASLDYLLTLDEPKTMLTAGSNNSSVDGWRIINISGLNYAVQSSHLEISDDNIHPCDFNFGKIFGSEETRMLRGKAVQFSTTLIDRTNSITVDLAAWKGVADAFTKDVFKSRNVDGPVLDANWELVDSFEIPQDSASVDHNATYSFDVPLDAVNYAIIAYPTTPSLPTLIKFKQFTVSVVDPINSYILDSPELLSELHLAYDVTHKTFIQGTGGREVSLRYTINNSTEGNPMPVGVPGAGLAPITLDNSVNTIPGSGAGEGEGAMVFGDDGKANIHTILRIANEQISASTVTFWWSTVGADGNLTKLVDSEQSFTVPAKSPGSIFAMEYDIASVVAGTKLALRAKSDSVDGAYMWATGGNPLIRTGIVFTSVDTISDDPDLISAPINKALVVDRRVYEFTGNTLQNIVISVNIPSDVELANIEVVKHSGTQTTSIRDAEYAYNSSTGELTVHVGPSVSEGRIYLEFWA